MKQRIMVNGRRYQFDWDPEAEGDGGLVTAPGVVPFIARSLQAARTGLRAAYSSVPNAKRA